MPINDGVKYPDSMIRKARIALVNVTLWRNHQKGEKLFDYGYIIDMIGFIVIAFSFSKV